MLNYKPSRTLIAGLCFVVLSAIFVAYNLHQNQSKAVEVQSIAKDPSTLPVHISYQQASYIRNREICYIVWRDKEIMEKVREAYAARQPEPMLGPDGVSRPQLISYKENFITPDGKSVIVDEEDGQNHGLPPKKTCLIGTPTASPTALPTLIASASPSPSSKPTATPTATPTSTPTSKPTPTPSPTPSPTSKPTATPTPSPTATPTPTPSPSSTPVTACSNGELKFDYDPALTATEADLAKKTIAEYYPKLVDFIGQPFVNKTILISPYTLANGAYMNNSTVGVIEINRFHFGDLATNPKTQRLFTSSLVHEMVHAWLGQYGLNLTLFEEGIRANAVENHFFGPAYGDGIYRPDDYGIGNYEQINSSEFDIRRIKDFGDHHDITEAYTVGATLAGKLYYERSSFFKEFHCDLYKSFVAKNWQQPTTDELMALLIQPFTDNKLTIEGLTPQQWVSGQYPLDYLRDDRKIKDDGVNVADIHTNSVMLGDTIGDNDLVIYTRNQAHELTGLPIYLDITDQKKRPVARLTCPARSKSQGYTPGYIPLSFCLKNLQGFIYNAPSGIVNISVDLGKVKDVEAEFWADIEVNELGNKTITLAYTPIVLGKISASSASKITMAVQNKTTKAVATVAVNANGVVADNPIWHTPGHLTMSLSTCPTKTFEKNLQTSTQSNPLANTLVIDADGCLP